MISVIVPVYKVEKYLCKCVDSLLNQSYKNFEIILVNDGSPDKCPAICDQYAEKNATIKVIHKQNGGLCSAWICGVKNVDQASEYITFVDSDDWVGSNYIEDFVRAIDMCYADVVIGNVIKFRGNEQIKLQQKRVGLFDKNKLEKELYPVLLNNGKFHGRAIPISRWGKLYKRELIFSNIKYCDTKTSYSEDLNITFPIILDAQSIYFLKSGEGVYYYRLNPESMLHAYDKNMLYSIRHVYPSLRRICNEKGYRELIQQVEADYLAASVQYFKNELQNPAGLSETKKNIKEFVQNNLLRKVIDEVDWSEYRELNKIIIRAMKNYNWFYANIVTALLSFLKKSGIRKPS